MKRMSERAPSGNFKTIKYSLEVAHRDQMSIEDDTEAGRMADDN